MNLYNKILTPCIGVCSTGIGDSVCRGCKRFDYEVIQWNSYSETEKQAIDKRLASLLSKIVCKRLEVVSSALLAEQLQLQQIRYVEYRDPYCWLYELLCAGATQITCCTDFGFQKCYGYEDLSLIDIRQSIDSEFYALSVAHFERYIVANSRRAQCVANT